MYEADPDDLDSLPSCMSSAHVKAMEGLEAGLLPVLLVNWNEDGECESVEWHHFEIEADGPAYDDSQVIRERFVCGVAIAIRYHDIEHEGECE